MLCVYICVYIYIYTYIYTCIFTSYNTTPTPTSQFLIVVPRSFLEK